MISKNRLGDPLGVDPNGRSLPGVRDAVDRAQTPSDLIDDLLVGVRLKRRLGF